MSFFDNHSTLYPWPEVLRSSGLKFSYKPREVWWKGWIDRLNLRKKEKVLEVGCGRGITLDRLAGEYGIEGFGVDIAAQAIADGKKQCCFPHQLKTASACKLPFKDNFFDAVVSFDTLEHIKDQKKAVAEMVRVLKPGGKILIYTINSRQRFTWNWLINKLGADIYKNVDHDPALFVNPAWLRKELNGLGVEVTGEDYFNAFFTLVADEVIVVLLALWCRFRGWENDKKIASMVLKLLTMVSRLLMLPLKLLDSPWTVFGHSNGYLIWGEKK